MKTILKSETVTVPDGVTVTVKTRKVVVKGPRGTLNNDLTHLPIDLSVSADGKTIKVERWFTSGKAGASIRTACTHVNNMIIGVTKVRRAAGRRGALCCCELGVADAALSLSSICVGVVLTAGSSRFSGLQIQDALRVRSLPHQRGHHQQGHARRDPQLPRRAGTHVHIALRHLEGRFLRCRTLGWSHAGMASR